MKEQMCDIMHKNKGFPSLLPRYTHILLSRKYLSHAATSVAVCKT